MWAALFEILHWVVLGSDSSAFVSSIGVLFTNFQRMNKKVHQKVKINGDSPKATMTRDYAVIHQGHVKIAALNGT